jgi:hypothetical protein
LKDSQGENMVILSLWLIAAKGYKTKYLVKKACGNVK